MLLETTYTPLMGGGCFETSSSSLGPGKNLDRTPGLGLLPSGSELFPWRILMPHLHLGIVKGNGSLTPQSNKPIPLRKIWKRDQRKISY